MSMTWGNAITEVEDLIKEVHVTSPRFTNRDKIAGTILDGVRYVAERLPEKLAGDIIIEDDTFSIGTSGYAAVPSNYYDFTSLVRDSDDQPAELLDWSGKGGFLQAKAHRNYGRYSCDNITLYCAFKGGNIYITPTPSTMTTFVLRYRRLPVDPGDEDTNLDLPKDQFCLWACYYAASQIALSNKDMQAYQGFANWLNSEAKSAGIRGMFIRVDVADTPSEQKIAEATA